MVRRRYEASPGAPRSHSRDAVGPCAACLTRWCWEGQPPLREAAGWWQQWGLAPREPMRPRSLGSRSAAIGPRTLSLIPNFVAWSSKLTSFTSDAEVWAIARAAATAVSTPTSSSITSVWRKGLAGRTENVLRVSRQPQVGPYVLRCGDRRPRTQSGRSINEAYTRGGRLFWSHARRGCSVLPGSQKVHDPLLTANPQ